MDRISALKFSKEILQKEFDKTAKKYADINTQIDEGSYLSVRRFQTLCDKKSKLKENIEAVELGINYLQNEIAIAERVRRREMSANDKY